MRPLTAVASGYQVCKLGSSCTIGEYLYDDSYTPITSATCTLTSRNPDGTIYKDTVAMTSASQNDGWYSTSFDTTGKDEGIYRSQVCCTSGSDYLCLDKTFEISTSASTSPTADDIASHVWDASTASHNTAGSFGANLQVAAPSTSDIWNYSDRSLTSYGSLIADIWEYTNRSLSSFSTLVTDIWSNATRTITAGTLSNGTHIATQEDVTTATGSAVTSIKGLSNKDLTQISTQVTGVQTTSDTINNKIDTLSTTVGTINTNVASLLTKWSTYTASDLITAVGAIQTSVGTTLDGCSTNTVFGNAYCAKSKWGAETASGLLTATTNVATTAAALRAELAYSGKSTTAYQDLQTLLANVGTVSTNVVSVQSAVAGVSTQVLGVQTTATTIQTTTSTGSAALAQITTKLDTVGTKIDSLTTNVGTLVTKWGTYSASDIVTGVSGVQTSLGTSSDGCLTSSLFGYAKCAKDKWGVYAADDLLTATTNVSTTAAALRTELGYSGKSTTAYQDLQTLSTGMTTVSTNLSTVQSLTAGIDTKVDTLTTKVDALATNVTTLNTNVNTLVSKWSTYTMSDVITKLTTLQSGLGASSNTCSDLTVFGYLTCIETNGVGGGGGGTSDPDILAAAQAAASSSAALRAELEYNGKSTTAYQDLQTLKASLASLQGLVGTSTDASSVSTLFGRISHVQETVASLDTSGAGLSDLLAKWGDTSASAIYDKVKDLAAKIDAVNSVSDVSSILTIEKSNQTDLVALKNKVLELRALTQVNKAILQNGTTKPVVKLWLEEGSVIFKTLITNPSSVRQAVPVKFYLPKEASEKDIIKVDNELIAHYDPDQEAVFVGGDFSLAPNESKIVAIEVTDIWKITDAECDSVRKQADDLFAPLHNTQYFAQGSTLKSDVNVAMDTVDRLQNEAKTPEARIKAYRDSKDQLKRAQDDLAAMKLIVAQAASAGTIMGSLGSVQMIVVWGVVIILTTAFVIIAVYMRMLTHHIKKGSLHINQNQSVSDVPEKRKHFPFLFPNLPTELRIIGWVVIVIVVASCVILISLQTHYFKSTSSPKILSTPSPSPTMSPSPIPAIRRVVASNNYGDLVNLHEGPGPQFATIGKMESGKVYDVIDSLTDIEKTEWLQLVKDARKKAWVSSTYVTDAAETNAKADGVLIRDSKQVLGVATQSARARYVVNKENVKLRMAPIANYRFKLILEKGEPVTKMSEEREWSNVQTAQGDDGWVKTDYIDKL